MISYRSAVLFIVAFLSPVTRTEAQRRAIQIDEFLTLDRVSEPQISPDGRWLVYTLTRTDLDSNRRNVDLWLAPVDAGPAPRRLTDDARGGRSARWAPDGTSLAYITSRGETPQLRLYSLASGRSRPITSLSSGIDGVIWSPSGTHLGFVTEVYATCADDACNRRRADEQATRPTAARVYDELLYRHWNRWDDGRRSHLFVIPVSGGTPVDVTLGLDADVPIPPFGDASDYAFHPDGLTIFYTTKLGTDGAWSTNSDIFQVGIAGPAGAGSANVTRANGGADRYPLPAPNGQWLAYASQARAGFESDKWRLLVRDLSSGSVRDLTRNFDGSVAEMVWLPDSRSLLFTAQQQQRQVIYRADLTGQVQEVLRWGNTSQLSRDETGRMVAFVNDAVDRPPQVYLWRLGSQEPPRAVTTLNAELLAQLEMRRAEEIHWVGADGKTVYGMVVKPPRYTLGARYPMVVLIHGGPQGAWLDSFHSRWNAQLFAAPGYVTVLLNPRGSTGFGQEFVDQISGDWGGRVYLDVMAGVEHAARLPYVDSTRIAAAGGSYGGYLVNWINGHSDRFDALVSHAGVYDLEAFYGATEELWFPEWEFGGPPWSSRAQYQRWSPREFADRFRTPTLVVHGALDFRVPDTQGLQLFTALRRQGIPARLLYFPDEGHWIGKPQNQKLWWGEVHAWLNRYLRPGLTQ